MVVGITGHQRLGPEDAWSWVAEAINSTLSQVPPPLVGLSSLAVGTDQLFAKLILEHGCELRVILPFSTYHATFAPGAELDSFTAILGRAAAVEILPAQASREESYLAAGRRIVDLSDRVIAVWNGARAAGLGGTGDIVQYALESRKDVLHIDPSSREVAVLSAKSKQRAHLSGLKRPARH